MMCGFINRISVDVSYLLINDVLEYNLPYMQSDFTCNPGPTIFFKPDILDRFAPDEYQLALMVQI